MWSAILRMGRSASRSSRMPSITGWFTARGCGRRVSLKRRCRTFSSASRNSRLTGEPPRACRRAVAPAGTARRKPGSRMSTTRAERRSSPEPRRRSAKRGMRAVGRLSTQNQPASSRAREHVGLAGAREPGDHQDAGAAGHRRVAGRAQGPAPPRPGTPGRRRAPRRERRRLRARLRHHRVHALREAPGRVVPALLQELVAGRHLHQDGDVAPGRHGHADQGQRHAQDRDSVSSRRPRRSYSLPCSHRSSCTTSSTRLLVRMEETP